MGTKRNPGEFDCYDRAADDEPLFVLLGHDAAASTAVRSWVNTRIRMGMNTLEDKQIQEALKCAGEMDEYAILPSSGG